MHTRPIAAAAALLASVSLPAPALAHAAYPWPTYSVLPILFSPTDWAVGSAEVQAEADALRSAMLDIQRFYGGALGGRTFFLNELQVVQGTRPKEGYGIRWNGQNIYTTGVEFVANMEAAVVEELHARGYPTPPAQNEDGYSVLVFVKGAGGYAGGRELGRGDGGWAILGDWAIDAIQGEVPDGAYWWSGRRQQTGAAAHELGHTFGLPHPDAYGGSWDATVMGAWWEYPRLGLNAWEVDRLAATKAPFFGVTSTPEPAAVALLAGALLPLAAVARIRARHARSHDR